MKKILVKTISGERVILEVDFNEFLKNVDEFIGDNFMCFRDIIFTIRNIEYIRDYKEEEK